MDVNVLVDILSAIQNHWRLIAGVLLLMLLSQSILWSILRLLFGSKLSSVEYYSLSLAGWILPLTLASVLWIVAGTVAVFVLLLLLAVILLLRARREPPAGSNSRLPILLALFGLFVLLRLAFVAEAIIPLYFDSAQHYKPPLNMTKPSLDKDLLNLAGPF